MATVHSDEIKINKILFTIVTFFNMFTITKNVGPLTFWLGPWIWNFRGLAGYWEKMLVFIPVDTDIFFVFRFLFNDAEVKQFDPNQIATECFGGEMTVRYCVLYVILWLQVALYLHKIYHDIWYMFEPGLSMDPDINKNFGRKIVNISLSIS